MNLKVVLYTLAKILKVEAILLVLPLIVSVIYKEDTFLSFLIPIAILLVIGFILEKTTKSNESIYAKEGLAIVGLAWIFLSVFGSLPFIISGEIPNVINAFFETVSGFTTTGATILEDVEVMSKGILFWRSFTHWIGGMGILVFILAFSSQQNSRNMFIMKAESPGHKVGKLVSRVKYTARILYLIYITLTIIEIVFLAFKMPIFDSIVHAFGTAGTGGFSIKNSSIAFYQSVYIETVITVFMILFGINFTLFYLIIIGNIKSVLKSEELKWYLGIIFIAILIIFFNTYNIYNSFNETLRHSSFQVASIITTTGYSSFNFNNWPGLSKTILIILMFIGACAGSTGGGMKISRIVIYFKIAIREIRQSIFPRQIRPITFEKKPIDELTRNGVTSYLTAYIFLFIIATLVISIEGKDLVTNFTAVAATINNIGPGLEIVGPMGNFSSFSNLSKITFSIVMLAGRLELFPILILFSPKLWIKK